MNVAEALKALAVDPDANGNTASFESNDLDDLLRDRTPCGWVRAQVHQADAGAGYLGSHAGIDATPGSERPAQPGAACSDENQRQSKSR